MKALRGVLLVLSLVMVAALAWRLGSDVHRPVQVAATTTPAPPAAAVPAAPEVPPSPAVPEVPPTPAVQPPPAVPAVAPPVTPAAPAPPADPQPPAPAKAGEAARSSASADATGMTSEAARKAIDARLQTAPDLVPAFAALKAQFPAVADRTLSAAADALRAGGEMPSPDDLLAAAMRDLRSTSGVLAAHAGPEALAAIFDAKAATLADLEAADPRICADYLFGGTSPEFGDFVVGHRALVARSAMATISAMADGRARQTSWDMPSPDDYQLIEKGLAAKGLSTGEIAALLDGKSLDPPPSDTRLCDNTRAYLDVMRSMPADARNRVYGLAAELLARS